MRESDAQSRRLGRAVGRGKTNVVFQDDWKFAKYPIAAWAGAKEAIAQTLRHRPSAGRAMPPVFRSIAHFPFHSTNQIVLYSRSNACFTIVGRTKVQTWDLHASASVRCKLHVSCCLRLEHMKMYAIATTKLQLRLVTEDFVCVGEMLLNGQVLCMAYDMERHALIVGGIGFLQAFSIETTHSWKDEEGRFTFKPKFSFAGIHRRDHISRLRLERDQHALYSIHESSIYVHDLETGQLREHLRQLHRATITACIHYKKLGYLVTAGKDARIRTWNFKFNPLTTLREHTKAVTGLTMVADSPILLSASLDGTVRAWNLDMSSCLFRFDMDREIFDLQPVADDKFYHVSRDGIAVWGIRLFQETFLLTRSPVRLLQPCRLGRTRTRIAMVTDDGSIRFISPITGEPLLTALPHFINVPVLAVIAHASRIYVAYKNSRMVVYDGTTNPCTFLRTVDLQDSATVKNDEICCLHLLPNTSVLYESALRVLRLQEQLGSAPCVEDEPPTLFLGAYANGELRVIQIDLPKRTLRLCEAHPSRVLAMHVDETTQRVLTLGAEGALKVWSTATPSAVSLLALQRQVALGRRPLLMAACGDHVALVRADNALATGDCMADASLVTLTERLHDRAVTSLIALPALDLYVSGDAGGKICVWSHSRMVLRELKLDEPILSLCFANERGDLLIGLPSQLSLIRVHEYLPEACLQRLLAMDFEDTKLEDAIPMDAGNPDAAQTQSLAGIIHHRWIRGKWQHAARLARLRHDVHSSSNTMSIAAPAAKDSAQTAANSLVPMPRFAVREFVEPPTYILDSASPFSQANVRQITAAAERSLRPLPLHSDVAHSNTIAARPATELKQADDLIRDRALSSLSPHVLAMLALRDARQQARHH